MAREYVLNAEEMEPPEPLVRTLELADTLGAGEYLRLRHRREPCLLYDNLSQRGFDHLTCEGVDVAYEVFIWHKGDGEAEAAARRAADRVSDQDLIRS